MNKVCFGCGVKLQSTDESKLGYIPAKKIDTAKYCMRCFRMIHYGEIKDTETPKDIKEIIRKVNNDDKFVLFLVDFLNISDEVIKLFKSVKGKKMLIINKCELMPKSVNKEAFLYFIANYYKIKSPIKLKGGTKYHGVTSLQNYLMDIDVKEAYVLGLSNSGKSTLINDLIRLNGVKVSEITVNKKANTTLDFLRVKLTDNLTLIDSPGFILKNSLNNDVTGKSIVSYSMNMKECETVRLLDSELYLKFDSNTPIVLYTNSVANKVIKKYFKAAPGLVNTIKIEEDNMDVVIKGIGFVTIKKSVNITTNIDLKYIEVRKSMFGVPNE